MRRLPLFLPSIALAACLVAAPSPARADDADPWFGKDKALHLGGTALLSGIGYGLGLGGTDHRGYSFLIGASVGIGAGAIKELADFGGLGTPSWKDFTWDVIGTAVGLTVAFLIDLAVRGWDPSPRAPPRSIERMVPSGAP